LNKPLKYWIQASRPHTLPLAASGILLGSALAYFQSRFHWDIFIAALITASILQILSNLANDLGDFIHGTDNQNRIGPERTVQSGKITANQMKKAVVLTATIAILSGFSLLLLSLKQIGWIALVILFVLGILSILAAYHYTASKKPYGYMGLGDLAVFIFFGLLSVGGAYYLQTAQMNFFVVLAAIAMGVFSAAVLNLNNIRDYKNDKESGKKTIVVFLGLKKGKIYHLFLLSTGIAASLYLMSSMYTVWWHWLFSLSVLLIAQNIWAVFHAKSEQDYYPLLKNLSMAILIFVVCISLSIILIK
jgi:1,4-dihydroxy-2-naphthoate octaprenyltransferase